MRPQFQQFPLFHKHAPTRPLLYVLISIFTVFAGMAWYEHECAWEDALDKARNAPPYAVLHVDAVKGITCVSCLEEAKKTEWKRKILESK